MSGPDIGANYDRFTTSAFRLETLPEYRVPSEQDALADFLAGKPRAERSIRTEPWLARIALTTLTQFKDWSRVHIVDLPLSDYLRYEFASYVESQAAGEQIRIIDRARHPEFAELREDFWLFDADTDAPFAHVQHYTDDGTYQGGEQITDQDTLDRYVQLRGDLWAAAEPLNVFLARLG